MNLITTLTHFPINFPWAHKAFFLHLLSETQPVINCTLSSWGKQQFLQLPLRKIKFSLILSRPLTGCPNVIAKPVILGHLYGKKKLLS